MPAPLAVASEDGFVLLRCEKACLATATIANRRFRTPRGGWMAEDGDNQGEEVATGDVRTGQKNRGRVATGKVTGIATDRETARD